MSNGISELHPLPAPTTETTDTPYPRLSLNRMNRLSLHTEIITGAVIVAAVLAWLVINHWSPTTFLPLGMQHGLRSVVTGIFYGYLLLWFAGTIWERGEAHRRVARTGQRTEVPTIWTPLAISAIALSAPMWPVFTAAWTENDIAPLGATWPHLLVLELPVIGLGVLAAVGTLWLDWVHAVLDRQQGTDTPAWL